MSESILFLLTDGSGRGGWCRRRFASREQKLKKAGDYLFCLSRRETGLESPRKWILRGIKMQKASLCQEQKANVCMCVCAARKVLGALKRFDVT